MKLNLKQVVAISWAWYFIQIIFWICLGAFFVYGFIFLMSSETTSKDEMQGNAGGAVIAILFMFFSLYAILQTLGKYPKRRIEMERDWTDFPRRDVVRPVYYWDNLIKEQS